MARTSILAVAACLAACGGPGGGAAPAPQPMTISAAGLSPRSAEVVSGNCLQVENADAVAHTITADDGAACPDLAQPQTIAPGATSTVCFMMGPEMCAFHGANRAAAAASGADPAFAGTIQVDASMGGDMGGMMSGR
jgi:hypothetical protein